MKAVVLEKPGLISVKEVDDPEILADTDAIVRITQTAICGADLLPFHGHTPGFENGTIMGHEFVGEIASVGSAVTSLPLGQRVVNTSTVSDGTCEHCLNARPSQCSDRSLFGYSGVYPRLEGGQAEFVRVPVAERLLMPLPDSVSDEAAVFLADVLPTGFASVRRGEVQLGDTVVVVGCGPVGVMAVMCALHLASRVIAVDGVPQRRELVAQLGATAVEPEAAQAMIEDCTGGLGADVVIEAAGSPGALTAALGFVRGRGTVSVVGAHFEPDYPLNNGQMFEREISLRFTIGDPFNDRQRLLGMIAAGVLDPTVVVSHRMPLADAAKAYELFDSREASKVVLLP